MRLYGRLDDVRGGKMIFAPNLKSNLDEADRVYNGINTLIDRHIAAKGIEAPPGSVYEPVWTPDSEPADLDLAGVAAIVWATGFTPDWSYVRIPIFDGTGYPIQRRGITRETGPLCDRPALALDLGLRPFPERRARCGVFGRSGAGEAGNEGGGVSRAPQ